MLKVRGKQEDIKRFLEILDEEQSKANEEKAVFEDLSTKEDKDNGIADITHEGNFIVDFVEQVCKELPGLKIYGYKFEYQWNGRTYYWSKAGTTHLERKEIGSFDPYATVEPFEDWWNKDGFYYTERKPDGTLSIVGYYRWDEELHIPETIDGEIVTELADRLFYGNPVVKDVYVGNNIQKVGSATFSSCHSLVLHTDNPVILTALKRTKVMIASSSDSEETIKNKRDFVYKASGKGITIYTYRGNEKEVVVPAVLDNLPVNKIAQKAFFGQYLHSLVLPIDITEFLPEMCAQGRIDYLAAPGVDIRTVDSVAWKQSLAKGFLKFYVEGIYQNKEVADSYFNYFKRSFDKYTELCVDDLELLSATLKTLKISAKDYETLINLANEKELFEAKTILLEYKDKNISEQTMNKYENSKAEKELKAPSPSKIKKDWTYKTNEGGGITLVSYKGSDENVIIPAIIENKPVTVIDRDTFVAIVSGFDNAQIKNIRVRRQKIATIMIPGSINNIAETAFIGCGDSNIGTQYYRWQSDSKMKKTFPPKVTLLVESKSFAEKFAKKEKMNYEIF